MGEKEMKVWLPYVKASFPSMKWKTGQEPQRSEQKEILAQEETSFQIWIGISFIFEKITRWVTGAIITQNYFI